MEHLYGVQVHIHHLEVIEATLIRESLADYNNQYIKIQHMILMRSNIMCCIRSN